MITVSMRNNTWRISIINEEWEFGELINLKDELNKLLEMKDKFGRIRK